MHKFRTGLTSVTFRQKSIDEIIAITRQAGLSGIEWGGDVHLPPGDVRLAAETAEKTHAAGLQVLSYGSYYHGGETEDFGAVLATAKALGAPVIRVWAGHKTYEESTPEEFASLARRFAEAAELAGKENIRISFEYHRGTATQTIEGALVLLKTANHPNISSYWQPNPDITQSEQLAEIDALLPYMTNVHVFTWTGANVRHPLADGTERWMEYLSHIRKDGKERDLILEFVQDDRDDALFEDAKTLHSWLNRLDKLEGAT